MVRTGLTILVSWFVFGAAPAAASTGHFESPPVHPLALSPDGTRLYAVNTFDHRLSVFDLTQGITPVLLAEVPVGLEPVTVRVRANGEIWVVNHLSDSVSILDPSLLAVRMTLPVGDEPTDVVFAGTPEKAFVCISQEDRVEVRDADVPGTSLGSVFLRGSDPRSLAVSPDGETVYACVLDSGNCTTVVPATVVQGTLGLPPPNPPMNPVLPAAPSVGLIVRHDGANWIDGIARNWSPFVPYTLPDDDVFAIDAALQVVTAAFRGVGTTLFNVAVHPSSGLLYVTNQEALNEIRFEPNLAGKFVRTRVTLVDPGTNGVVPLHLNAHIDYANAAGDPGERSLSLAFPLDAAVSPDGQRVYVAAFGSAKVAVLDASAAIVRRIAVGEGPCGLALAGDAGPLYVLNRMSGTVSTVDLTTDTVVDVSLGFDPTPEAVRAGRAVFYDAENGSAHGDISCASCHIFGGMDNLGWDLGDPTGSFQPPPPGQLGSAGFHPMKGPMTTQSLKGLDGTEPLHWRGDRANLADFNGAFVSLQGRGAPLPSQEFADFQAFVVSMRYPPNPLRNLDGSLPNPASGPNPTHGEQLYLTGNLVGALQCVDCHALPTGENGLIIPAAALLESQDMVVPQLRNMYEKTRFNNQTPVTVRGFGFTHDGAVDDLFSFLQFPGFNFASNADREDVAAFLLHFDTGTHAAVGAQWTMDGSNEGQGLPRLTVMLDVADQGAIGMIAKGLDASGVPRGWSYAGGGTWISDRESEGTLGLDALLGLAGPGTEVTFTAVLPGCETRLGVDRDEDGFRDTDEVDAGSDPADPDSVPSATGIEERSASPAGLALRAFPNPATTGATEIALTLERDGAVAVRVFDARGRLVRTLLDGAVLGAGSSSVRWDLRDASGAAAPAGIYFVQVQTPEGVAGTRLAVVR